VRVIDLLEGELSYQCECLVLATVLVPEQFVVMMFQVNQCHASRQDSKQVVMAQRGQLTLIVENCDPAIK
jgi:hypothetical protein